MKRWHQGYLQAGRRLSAITPLEFYHSEEEPEYVQWLSEETLYAQAAWKGLYSGLYSSAKKGQTEKPGDDCLGQWIVDDINHLRTFR